MKLIINNIKLSLHDEQRELKRLAAKKLKLNEARINTFKIVKESVDARRKTNIHLVYSVLAEVDDHLPIPTDNDIRFIKENKSETLIRGMKKLNKRPIIIGTGPAGLFAGLILARNGYKPLVFERGESVDYRTEIVNQYWNTGKLNLETNVQFGEGGAGTFSDGKLTTRINDRRCDMVLEEFYHFGAHEEILFKFKPHIGTDVLKKVVKEIRNEIIALGGEVRFNAKLTGLKSKQGKIESVTINGTEKIETEVMVLAIGHSARDTYEALYNSGVTFVQKPFSIGVRIEHPQEMINYAQYGNAKGHPKLGAADYQLFHKIGQRTVYSFCMCPGGVVVASASEENTIVTNGMSEFARDKMNANSALVVSVEPADFGDTHPLAGIAFQRKWERLAFDLGGRDHAAPVQRLEDFIAGRASGNLGMVKPSYTGNTKVTDINGCLPLFVTNPMKESIQYFDQKLKGFGSVDSLLTGVETRTSAPVRIPRNELLEAEGLQGLYPAGEGAGYAGGIVSAAVDGIKIAEQIMKTYSQPVE